MTHVIRCIDFETTGMEPPAQVIEMGWCDLVQRDGEWLVDNPASILFGANQPMDPSARAAHHISPAEIHGLTPFGAEGMWVATKEDDGVSVVAAHNAEFEGKFWGQPTLPVLCTYKAALRVWPEAPSHANGALRYWLEDRGLIRPTHETTIPAHRAGPDAYVTAHILTALLKHATAAEMVAWTREPRLLPTCPLGKFRGKAWPDVEAGFLNWMLAQASMESDLKWNAQRELDRRRVAVRA